MIDEEYLKRIIKECLREVLNEQKPDLVSNKPSIDIDELCELRNLTKRRIYQLTHKNDLPHFKDGKFLRFDLREVDEWLMRNKIKTKDQIEGEAATIITLNKNK